MEPVWWGVLLAVLGVGSLALAMAAAGRWRQVADTPTSKAQGVFIGEVELAGTVQCAAPLRSPMAGIICGWYRNRVEEEWERWETEVSRDSKGNVQTRRVRKSGWKEIASDLSTTPFLVADETGAVQVLPAGAEVHAPTVFSERADRGSALYYRLGPPQGIADSTGRRRFHEEALGLGGGVFVWGRAQERTDCVAPEIVAAQGTPLVISAHGEKSLLRGWQITFWLGGLLALAFFGGASGVLTHAFAGAASTASGVVAGLGGGLCLWLGWWVLHCYNGLIRLRHRTREAWALVDIQLKRRADLLPALVAAVDGLRSHERETLEAVAALRTQATATPAGQPGPDLAATAATVRLLAERYPTLRSDTAFAALARQLTETENRLALAREYYNTIAMHLNNRREVVPDGWIARLAQLAPASLLTAVDFERAAPVVKLAE